MAQTLKNRIPTINKIAHWSPSSVRIACIKNDLYDCGYDGSYKRMLEKVEETPNPTDDDIWMIAQDINDHTDYQTVTNIMYILTKEAITYTFTIDGRDDI